MICSKYFLSRQQYIAFYKFRPFNNGFVRHPVTRWRHAGIICNISTAPEVTQEANLIGHVISEKKKICSESEWFAGDTPIANILPGNRPINLYTPSIYYCSSFGWRQLQYHHKLVMCLLFVKAP